MLFKDVYNGLFLQPHFKFWTGVVLMFLLSFIFLHTARSLVCFVDFPTFVHVLTWGSIWPRS